MGKIDSNNIFDTLKKSILVDGFHVVIDLKKSHDNYIVDSVSNKEYLDCYSYFASLPLGHNHPKMFKRSFLKKLKNASLANPANADIYCKEYAESIDTFARLAKPDGFRHMFFVAGGALAVENALKTAFDWKVQKNFEKGYKEEKGSKVIHFKEAFHGRSGYTLSLTNTDPVKVNYFPKFDWPRIINPKLKFPISPESIRHTKNMESLALEQIIQAIAINHNDIAALIIEPIQGEGGDNHFRPEFFKKLRKICDECEIMFIMDEVQTGVGATGKMWAYEHFGIVPDIIAFGKKTQVCGIMATARVDEIKDNVFNVSSRINSTWGGNLADFVRGARYLEIIHEDNLVKNAYDVGDYFLTKLYELDDKIDNIRGKGLFIAFDASDKEARNNIRNKAWDKGLATLACGTKSVRFRPPLTFTKENVDEAIFILKDCI